MREGHRVDNIDIAVGAGEDSNLIAASAIDSFTERLYRVVGQ